MLKLKTKDYGTLEYEKEDLIHFSDGLFGFQELHDYLPLSLDAAEDNPILILQSVENPYIAFVVIDPFSLDPDYRPEVSPEELSYLGADGSDKLTFYVICVLRDNYLESTVNMKCPLVMNPATRQAMQVILSGGQYQYRHPLGSFGILSGAHESC